MSLRGLSQRELDLLYLSVGSHKLKRALSPIEVGTYCRRAKMAGESVKQIASALRLSPTMVGRFLKVLQLDTNRHHLVDWGESKFSVVGFSTASEVVLIPESMQQQMVDAVCQYGLSKNEARSVRQLLERSGRPFDNCVNDVIGRRPIVVFRELVVGSITDNLMIERLAGMLQLERDALLLDVLSERYPDTGSITAKLGIRRFTVLGGKSVRTTIGRDPDFEFHVTSELAAKGSG